jgi:tetratricopeptide (TPR) repeat protein
MRVQKVLIMFATALLLGGCGMGQVIKNNIQGPHYLQTREYRTGEQVFREAVAIDPDSGQANYYLGRFLLAGKKPGEALKYLDKAVALDPHDTDYLFWQGVALGELGKRKEERAAYEKVLKLNPRHLQALIYLGHNLLKAKQYQAALETYQKALDIWPYSPSSLYNRALIAKILGRTAEEKAGWLAYLSAYPSGALAAKATDHLNLLGDFSYRNHYLGPRRITLTRIRFLPFTAEIAPSAKPSLDLVGATAANMGKGKLQVVVFLENDKKMARARAVAIKKYLLAKFPGLGERGIGISWFDRPQTLVVAGKKLHNPESVSFFLTDIGGPVLSDRKKKRAAAR